jgi:DNA-binding IclR family transcriptional regulator
MKELEKIRRDGYSADDEEYIEGLICFGAPVFDFNGMPVAAVSISCPKYRYDREKHLQFYTGLVTDAALRISVMMGYTSPPRYKAE